MVILDVLEAASECIPTRARAYIKRAEFVQRLYDRLVVARSFREKFGRKPNLRNPTTFNEKVLYKMLHDRRPILTRIADKIRMRDYVVEKIGAQHVTKAYQICDATSEVDWQTLPQRFVIKANHGSAMNIIVSDKDRLDIAETVSILDAWLARNFYFHLREWAYRDIRPGILIEENLSDYAGIAPIDWKFFTFEGRVELLQVDLDRFTGQRRNLYDRQLRRLSARSTHPPAARDPPFPKNIETMFSLAEQLGHGLDFVRVDLYNVGGRILVGELTNYPAAGLERYDPLEFEVALGRKWRLPSRYA